MLKRHDILAMCDFVEHEGLSEHTLAQLREQYAGTHFTWCMEDDISVPRSYIDREKFSVYLVDSRDHCSKLSNDEESASGVVFAENILD